MHCVSSAPEHIVRINAAYSNGQKTHCCKYRISAADIIGNHKGFVSLAVGKLLQLAAFFICSDKNAFPSAFLSIFLFQKLPENTEGNSGFCSGSRFGYHIHTDILSFTKAQRICKSRGRNAVTGKINLRCISVQAVIIVAAYKFNGCPRPQIRTSDSNHNQHITTLSDLFCRCLNPCVFFFIIIYRTADPSQKV